jgi:hypothetical protein
MWRAASDEFTTVDERSMNAILEEAMDRKARLTLKLKCVVFRA